jgi:hypothetical protein
MLLLPRNTGLIIWFFNRAAWLYDVNQQIVAFMRR